MTEMDQSGSEGGVALTPPSLPLSVARRARWVAVSRYAPVPAASN